MKKYIIATLVLICSLSTKAQFSNTDTLRAFVNRWIRNSAVEAFQNLRLNTALIGMTNFIDSAYGGQVLNFEAVNDTTARLVTISEDTFSIYLRGNGITALRRRPGTDSVEYLKNGSGWLFAYKDSTGGGSSPFDSTSMSYRISQRAPMNTVDTTRIYVPLLIFAGESNAAGNASTSGLSGSETSAFPKVQILHNVALNFQPLQIGTNNNINVNLTGTYGWELQLMKNIQSGQRFLWDTVYLVKTCRAGATIQTLIDSLPTAYRRLDSAITQIRRKGYYPQIYIWYSQGINDGGSTDSVTWRNKTLSYLTKLRNRYGFAPIFHTLLIGAGIPLINTVNQLPYWDGFSYIVNTTGFSTGDPNHWDSAGLASICKKMISLSLDTIGERDKYVQAQVNKEKYGYHNNTLLVVDHEAIIDNITIHSLMGNHFFGYNTPVSPTGNYNTGLGYTTLRDLTTGNQNTALGFAPMQKTTSGSDNTGVGYNALIENTTGSKNTTVGSFGLTLNTTGTENTSIGYASFANNITGSKGTAIGAYSMQSGSGGNGNTALGAFSLRNVTGDYSTAIGYNSLLALTSGGYSVGVGVNTLLSATTGNHNIALGYGALGSITSTSRNIAAGTNAMGNSSGADYNISIGVESNRDNAGDNNTIIGDAAMLGPTSLSGMVVLGYNVGQNANRSNELWIDNTATYSPLLHGDFTNDTLMVNGKLRVRDADSVGMATGGFVFRDAITKEFKLAPSGGVTSINSQTGTSQTISAGPGLAVNSSSDVHTVSLNNTLDVQVTDANNTGTSATDLYSKTIAANQFTLNGQSIHFEAAGVNNDATATVNLEALFAGTSIAGTGAVTISGTGAWSIQGTIIRATSTTARVYTVVTIDNSTQKVFSSTANLTSLDFTATNILKIQATAGGGGGGSNDITAQMWKVVFQP